MTQTPNNGWDAIDTEDLKLQPEAQYETQVRAEAVEAEQAEQAEEAQPGPSSAEGTQQPTTSPAAAEATKEEAQATETSPKEKEEKGFWDLSGFGQGLTYMGQPIGETNEQVKERLSAPGQGIIDFGVELINKIPGVNIPKVGKYEDDLAQATRQISSVVLPTIAGTGAIRAVGAAVPAPAAAPVLPSHCTDFRLPIPAPTLA